MEADADWVLFNALGKGFFRVKYDESNYRALNKQLNEDPTVYYLLHNNY